MNVYIWERISLCSGNYHTEGGVVVIANTEEEARELFAKHPSLYQGNYLEPAEYTYIQEGETPVVYPLLGWHEQKVFIFPDAGCC